MFSRGFCLQLVAAFWLLSFSYLAVASIAATKLPVSPVPAWTIPLSVKLTTAVKPKDVSGGYHVLLRDTQFDVESQTTYHHNGYVVFTDEGLQAVSEIQVTYDPNYEKINFHSLRIWRNGKLIDKIATVKFKQSQVEQELDKHIYNEQLSAIAILDDVRINDIVEFSYSVKGWNPIFKNKFFNSCSLRNYDPIDELYVRVNTTPKRKINYKLFNSKEQPTITLTNSQHAYTWHLKNLPGFPVDSDIPSWYDPYPWVSLSEYTNWQEFGQWAATLYEVKGLSKDLELEIDSIKNISGDAGERLTATVRFVQDKVRYLGLENGISGYKPHAPAQTYQQRFGDCKDKSLLLSQMLQAMNIKAYPALVHTDYQDQISKWLPSAYAFDHCIVMVELLGKKIWIDPTISLQRGRFNSIAIPNYKMAFVLKKDGGTFVKMQTPQIAKVKVDENYIFDNVGGPVKLEVKTYYYGSEADNMRQRLATSNLKETEKSYLNFYANTYPNITVSRDLDYIDNPNQNILTTLEEYTIQDLWSKVLENQDSLITAYFYPQMLRDRLSSPNTVIRKMPIKLFYPTEFEQTITLLLPEPWSVEHTSKVIQDKSFRFQNNINYNATSNSIILNYTYKTLRDHVPVAEAGSYLKKQKEVLDKLGFEISKPINTTSAQVTHREPINLIMVGLSVLFITGWVYGAYKLQGYNPASTVSNHRQYEIGGWLVLVYLNLYLSSLATTFNLFNNFFKIQLWSLLTDPTYEGYNPTHAFLILFELASTTAFLVYIVLLIWLFHQRRTSVPRLLILFYGINFLYIFFDNALAAMLKISDADFKQIFYSLVAASIWIPYFIKSIRVKRTFTQRIPQSGAERRWLEEKPEETKALIEA